MLGSCVGRVCFKVPQKRVGIKKMTEKNNEIIIPFSAGDIIRKLFISWFAAAIIMYGCLPESAKFLGELEAFKRINPAVGFLTALIVFLPLVTYPFFWKQKPYIERIMLFAEVVLLSIISVIYSFAAPFLGACTLLLGIMLIYMDFGWNKSDEIALAEEESEKEPGILSVLDKNNMAPKVAFLIGIAFVTLLSAWLVCRVLSHSTPTYDFGIFTQMFYSMKTHGTMVTTVERTEAMSHMCIHVSPVWYLLLPFYLINSTPEMLEFLQALVLASAFIPVWLICKNHGLSKWERVVFILLLAIYPNYMGGASYDIHENIFLTPFILWFFYGLDKKNIYLISIFTALTLLVKEDAAIYVAVIAVFILLCGILRKKDRKFMIITGAVILVCSVIYFISVVNWLYTYGDGILGNSRYNNFMYEGKDSLFSVIKAVLMEPMKVIYECFDEEKLSYMAMTIGAFALLPLITRKYERLILLIPYVLVNLMPDYIYAYNINHHYGYGSVALMLYVSVVNYQDIKAVCPNKKKWLKNIILVLAVYLSFGAFRENIIPKAMNYMERYRDHKATYDAREWLMDQIPDDKSVAASTFFTTRLSDRDKLYDVKHSKIEYVLDCDYIFVDYGETECFKRYKTTTDSDGYTCFKKLVLENGYVLSDLSSYGIDIYVKNR